MIPLGFRMNLLQNSLKKNDLLSTKHDSVQPSKSKKLVLAKQPKGSLPSMWIDQYIFKISQQHNLSDMTIFLLNNQNSLKTLM